MLSNLTRNKPDPLYCVVLHLQIPVALDYQDFLMMFENTFHILLKSVAKYNIICTLLSGLQSEIPSLAFRGNCKKIQIKTTLASRSIFFHSNIVLNRVLYDVPQEVNFK
jgi:hypothetical protein